jgi:hypothetical protein
MIQNCEEETADREFEVLKFEQESFRDADKTSNLKILFE